MTKEQWTGFGERVWVHHDPQAMDYDKVWLMIGKQSAEPDVYAQHIASIHDDVELANRIADCLNAFDGCPDPAKALSALEYFMARKGTPSLKNQVDQAAMADVLINDPAMAWLPRRKPNDTNTKAL